MTTQEVEEQNTAPMEIEDGANDNLIITHSRYLEMERHERAMRLIHTSKPTPEQGRRLIGELSRILFGEVDELDFTDTVLDILGGA